MQKSTEVPQRGSQQPTQLNLISSNRLQALRNQASPRIEETPNSGKTTHAKSAEDPYASRLREKVNQRLDQILDQLPAGRRQSLFKIRFGVTLGQFHELSVTEMARILKIGPPIR
ncbi:MAG: hypothetical protein ACU836_05020 [Gammaproteobacteria bacterium]